ncbi:hypothetical protein AB0H43_05295 [Hamadaea sp. NPDC050747]|uniref:hypothetical protein n=1 Tax=Hamadaea sp. NPDC050747 TaxID=3155789 RepID=UPI0033CB89C5
MARKRRTAVAAAVPPPPVERSPVVAPDSPLAVTARELLAAHTPPEGSTTCPRCEVPDPCAIARHASIVCLAARDPAEETALAPAG